MIKAIGTSASGGANDTGFAPERRAPRSPEYQPPRHRHAPKPTRHRRGVPPSGDGRVAESDLEQHFAVRLAALAVCLPAGERAAARAALLDERAAARRALQTCRPSPLIVPQHSTLPGWHARRFHAARREVTAPARVLATRRRMSKRKRRNRLRRFATSASPAMPCRPS